MRVAFSVAVTAVALLSAAFGQNVSVAAAAGDPEYGKLLAQTWCSSCHLVAPNENRPALADVPTFTDIARQLPDDADVLAAFIANPHPPMPDLSLSRKDIRDILAYLATLK
jgi:mono/diheme cytochrome c family protein